MDGCGLVHALFRRAALNDLCTATMLTCSPDGPGRNRPYVPSAFEGGLVEELDAAKADGYGTVVPPDLRCVAAQLQAFQHPFVSISGIVFLLFLCDWLVSQEQDKRKPMQIEEAQKGGSRKPPLS
jgi:hypothetical protein